MCVPAGLISWPILVPACLLSLVLVVSHKFLKLLLVCQPIFICLKETKSILVICNQKSWLFQGKWKNHSVWEKSEIPSYQALDKRTKARICWRSTGRCVGNVPVFGSLLSWAPCFDLLLKARLSHLLSPSPQTVFLDALSPEAWKADEVQCMGNHAG